MSKTLTLAGNKAVFINTIETKVFNTYLCSISGKKEDVFLVGENYKTTPSALVIKNFKTEQTFSTRKTYFKRTSSDQFSQESQEVLLRKYLANQ